MRVCQRQGRHLWQSLREWLLVPPFTRAFLKSPSSRGLSAIAELLVAFCYKQEFQSKAEHSYVYLIMLVWPWPSSHDLDAQPWPSYSEYVSEYQKWSLQVKAFNNYSRTEQTDKQTDRQTDATKRITTAYSRMVNMKAAEYILWNSSVTMRTNYDM